MQPYADVAATAVLANSRLKTSNAVIAVLTVVPSRLAVFTSSAVAAYASSPTTCTGATLNSPCVCTVLRASFTCAGCDVRYSNVP